MGHINEIRGKGTLIPLNNLITILLQNEFYNIYKDMFDNEIETSVNLATVFNSFIKNSAIFKPVFYKIKTDKGIFNPSNSVIIIINGEFFDLTNKVYNATLISTIKRIDSEYSIKNNDILQKYIKETYLNNYINTLKVESIKKSDIHKILKTFNYTYKKLFNEVLYSLINIDFALYYESTNYNIDFDKLFKNNKKYFVEVYKETVDSFITKEIFNLLKENYVNLEQDRLNLTKFNNYLFKTVLEKNKINWKVLEED